MTVQDIVQNFDKYEVGASYDTKSSLIDEAYRRYNMAIDQIKMGDLQDARVNLKTAVKFCPDFDDAYILLGLSIFAYGNRMDAMKMFNCIKTQEKHDLAMRYFEELAGKPTPKPEPKTEYTFAVSPENSLEPEDITFIMKDSSPFAETESDFTKRFRKARENPQHRDDLVTDMSDVRIAASKIDSQNEPAAPSKNESHEAIRAARKQQNRRNIISMIMITIACLVVLGILSWVSMKLHLKYINKNNAGSQNAVENTREPTAAPTVAPTALPTVAPTSAPTEAPRVTEVPTAAPTEIPTEVPTAAPTAAPTTQPSADEARAYLIEMEKLLKQKDYYNVFININNYDWTNLPYASVSEKDRVLDEAREKFSKDYYNKMLDEGVAKENWKRVIEWGRPIADNNPDYERNDGVYFSLGKAYEFTGDNGNAKKYYELAIEKFPSSKYASYAQSRLSHIS